MNKDIHEKIKELDDTLSRLKTAYELFSGKETGISCDNGVSVLVINSEKGQELMKRYGQDMELYPALKLYRCKRLL